MTRRPVVPIPWLTQVTRDRHYTSCPPRDAFRVDWPKPPDGRFEAVRFARGQSRREFRQSLHDAIGEHWRARARLHVEAETSARRRDGHKLCPRGGGHWVPLEEMDNQQRWCRDHRNEYMRERRAALSSRDSARIRTGFARADGRAA